MTPRTEKASFQGLSFTQLKELLAQTEDAIADRRIEKLKVLADGYAKKLAMNGSSIREGHAAARVAELADLNAKTCGVRVSSSPLQR